MNDFVPGTLKPRAIAVLDMLEGARDRRLTTATIAKKLGENYLRVDELLWDMTKLGLLSRERARTVSAADHWHLETRLAVRAARP